MWLFIALAVAVILDRARLRGRSAWSQSTASRRGLGRLAYWPLPLFSVLALVTVVSLVPGWPYNINQVNVPPGAVQQPTVVADVSGGTLLTYPLARNVHNLPMVWQSIDDFQYRIPAGEASVADGHSGATEAAFADCWQVDRDRARAPSRARAEARTDFATWKVRAVVIPLTNSINPMCAVRFVEAVLGRPPLASARRRSGRTSMCPEAGRPARGSGRCLTTRRRRRDSRCGPPRSGSRPAFGP